MGISVNTLSKTGVGAALIVAMYLLFSGFAFADTAPTITTNVRNNADLNTVITSANIGASVRNVAKVASSTGPTPQGSVNFNVYSNTACSGSPTTTESSINLVNGAATSSAYVMGAGGLSFKVHYNHDANNVDADSPCASVSATSNTSAITTTLSTTSPSVLVGSNINNTATLTGVTANAGGNVKYSVFSDNACQTPFAGAGIKSVTNGVALASDNVLFNTPGTYYWQAVYSGDANNSAATSTCTGASLSVLANPFVKNNPTLAITLSTTSSVLLNSSIFGSSVLGGATANATGSVKYTVYSNNTCSTLWADAGTQAVTDGIVPNAAPVLFNVAGTYYWQAAYTGDANNNPATSSCTSGLLTVLTGPGTPPPAAGTFSGTVYNDKNQNDIRDAGEGGLAGFTVNLYSSPNFNNGKYDPVYKTTVTDANGNYSFTGLANGTYSVEQLLKDGWRQTTNDFASVTITNGVGVSGLNFGDVAKKDAGKNCKVGQSNVKGKWWKQFGKHKKDCRTEYNNNANNHGNHGNNNNGNNGNGNNNGNNNGNTGNNNGATSTGLWIFRSVKDLGNGLFLGVFVGKDGKGTSSLPIWNYFNNGNH